MISLEPYHPKPPHDVVDILINSCMGHVRNTAEAAGCRIRAEALPPPVQFRHIIEPSIEGGTHVVTAAGDDRGAGLDGFENGPQKRDALVGMTPMPLGGQRHETWAAASAP